MRTLLGRRSAGHVFTFTFAAIVLLPGCGSPPQFKPRDGGADVLHNESFVRRLLHVAGRPTRSDERLELLFVTPLDGTVDWIDVLSEVASDSEYQIRQGVALLLGHYGDPRAIPLLRRLAADSDNDVRRDAAEALGRLGDKGLAQVLQGVHLLLSTRLADLILPRVARRRLFVGMSCHRRGAARQARQSPLL